MGSEKPGRFCPPKNANRFVYVNITCLKAGARVQSNDGQAGQQFAGNFSGLKDRCGNLDWEKRRIRQSTSWTRPQEWKTTHMTGWAGGKDQCEKRLAEKGIRDRGTC